MLKKLVVMSLSALLLTGCGGTSEEETVHAPEYLSITEVSVSIGDETVVYTATNNEAVKSYSDKQFVVYPDKTLFDTVQVDFVQGNSLNNYIQAYYDGVAGEKSTLIDGSFTTASKAYCLKQTEDLNYIIVCGDKSNESFVNDLCERL